MHGATRPDVSRETLAHADSAKRRYVSPARRHRSEATRVALLDEALQLVAQGNFRPTAREIAARARVHPSAVTRHFGSVELLYRIVARERRHDVLAAIGAHEAADLAWLVMVGKPRHP